MADGEDEEYLAMYDCTYMPNTSIRVESEVNPAFQLEDASIF